MEGQLEFTPTGDVRMWLYLLVTSTLVGVVVSGNKCGDGKCTCYPQMEMIDCRDQFLERMPSDFTTTERTYTQYINLKGNSIRTMQFNMRLWTSVRVINLMDNPINCDWLDKQNWKILAETSCKLTDVDPWKTDGTPKAPRKQTNDQDNGRNDPGDDDDDDDDSYEDYDDDDYDDDDYDDDDYDDDDYDDDDYDDDDDSYEDYDDDDDNGGYAEYGEDEYQYTDNGNSNRKNMRSRKSKRYSSPSAGTVTAIILATIIFMVAIVFGILFYMKRSREMNQRRRLDNIMTATDDE